MAAFAPAPVDSTPPTLASADIVDNDADDSVSANDIVMYTLTFSEGLDLATVYVQSNFCHVSYTSL
jgi:hypothetical protein